MTSASEHCEYTPTLRGNHRSWKRWIKWGVAGLQTHGKSKYTTILTYHRILPTPLTDIYSSPHIIVTQDTFRKHMQLLREDYHPLSLTDYLAARLTKQPVPDKSVIITFDDGWQDNYQFALPILQEHKIPATIFLTTDYIDTKHVFWPENLHFLLKNQQKPEKSRQITPPPSKKCFQTIENLKCAENSQRNQYIKALEEKIGDITFPQEKHAFLTWSQVQKMQETGIEFGSHGSSHSILTHLTKKQVNEECQTSREVIHQKTGISPSFFAYPNGNFTPEIQKSLKNAGYQAALTTFSGKNSQKTDLYALKRINMSESRFLDPFSRFSPALFKQILP